MGFFQGLEAERYDRTYSDRELFLRIWAYFRPHLRRIVAAAIALGLNSFTFALSPILVSQGVDLVITDSSGSSLGLVVVALFAVGILLWASNWIRRRLISRTTGDVMLALRNDAFGAVAAQGLAFFGEFSSGRIVSRITSDTDEFAKVIVLITDITFQLLQMVILLVVLVQISARLTLWLLTLTPVIYLSALLFRYLARRVTRVWLRALANVNAAIKEAVTGIAVAKNFRQEGAIYADFDDVNRQSYGINVRRAVVLSLVFPVLNTISGIGDGLIAYLGGLTAASGAITFGAWYLFLNSLTRFWFPVLNLSAFWSQIQAGLSAAERVLALIDAESAVVQLDHIQPSRLRGEIVFEQLDFHYKPEEPVLKRFNLHIRPGESVALVGHTGSGKSTLARLIARFYEYQGGSLRVDDYDIRTLDLRAYRRQLGIVSQTPFLFSGSVLDNIRYAAPGVVEDEITGLAGQIGEGEWLETLPEGLQTEVGERGGRLSMGQRQLVSLLRVMVQRPAIFILDEATASVDPFTEFQIQQALQILLAETTSIIIAHRLSTVRASDRIIVLREGEIIEEGDHERLMLGAGHYAELYDTYFRHQSLAYVEEIKRAALGGS